MAINLTNLCHQRREIAKVAKSKYRVSDGINLAVFMPSETRDFDLATIAISRL